MRHLEPTKIIISACQGKSKSADWRNHCDLAADLALLGVHFREVEGRYDGVDEIAFVCWPDGRDHELGIEALATCYGQESVLYVHGDRCAELVYSNGARKVIGTFQEVSEAEALAADAYTRDPENNRFFGVR